VITLHQQLEEKDSQAKMVVCHVALVAGVLLTLVLGWCKFWYAHFAHERALSLRIADLERIGVDEASERLFRGKYVTRINVAYHVPLGMHGGEGRGHVSG